MKAAVVDLGHLLKKRHCGHWSYKVAPRLAYVAARMFGLRALDPLVRSDTPANAIPRCRLCRSAHPFTGASVITDCTNTTVRQLVDSGGLGLVLSAEDRYGVPGSPLNERLKWPVIPATPALRAPNVVANLVRRTLLSVTNIPTNMLHRYRLTVPLGVFLADAGWTMLTKVDRHAILRRSLVVLRRVLVLTKQTNKRFVQRLRW
jgi:hypothetical protein